MKQLSILILLTTLVVSTPALGQNNCRAGAYPVTQLNGYEHDKWVEGAGNGDVRIEFDGFVANFDGKDDDQGIAQLQDLLRQPNWVSFEIKKFEINGEFAEAPGFRRPNPWYEFSRFPNSVPTVDEVTTVNLDKSYSGEGRFWNRGHMATRSQVNRISPEAGCNSHMFANSIPQYWSLNQGEWLAAERITGALANKFERAWSINGPIFYPGFDVETIGEGSEPFIPIPHAVFKVAIYESKGERYVRALLFPQPRYEFAKEIAQRRGGNPPRFEYNLCRSTEQKDYDFTPFKSSLEEIEKLTGMTFFPDASVAERAYLNEFSKRKFFEVEPRFFARMCGKQVRE